MLKSNRVPKIALLTLLFGFAYIAILILLGQERAMDWGLSNDEFYPIELVFPLMAGLTVCATWVLSMYRAHRQGSWRWFVSCLFIWPLSFVYTLLVNTGDEH
jgi:small neutral amino acid transporter SnatA (MarC family)